jgi:uncharacterized protein YqeY
MSLKARINEDMKAALRARQPERLKAIRLLLAAIKQREVDERIELADPDVLAVIDKMIKQRRESIVQFDGAGRKDLADQERAEIAVLEDYLPQALSPGELEALVAGAIDALGAKTLKDMGAVMTQLRPQVSGRADMGLVSKLVRERLGR